MKFKTKGKSLKELLKEYGTGSSGLYPQDWYKKAKFFAEKPEAGEWDIDFTIQNNNKTYKEQIGVLKEGYKPIHVATLVEIILAHYNNTGIKLLKNRYSRTNTLGSDGSHVYVGSFDSEGLDVGYWYDDYRSGNIGLASARKLDPGTLVYSDSPDILTLDSAIKLVKENGYLIYKQI